MKRASQIANKGRTFTSGPYLDRLFRQAATMDQRLQADICARIKQARKEAGFTQQEAADVLAMTLRGYQNYEKSRMPFRSLSRIAEVFGVDEQWLLHGAPPRVASDDQLARIEADLGEIRGLLAGLLRAADERSDESPTVRKRGRGRSG